MKRITIELPESTHMTYHTVTQEIIKEFDFDPLKYCPRVDGFTNSIIFATTDGQKAFTFRLPKRLNVSGPTQAGRYRLQYHEHNDKIL